MKRFTCRELAEVITAYFDDALDQPSHRAVETHLACCSACVHYVDQYRATIAALADPPPEKLSDRTRDSLLSAFRNQPR